jgi:hypothetical protein
MTRHHRLAHSLFPHASARAIAVSLMPSSGSCFGPRGDLPIHTGGQPLAFAWTARRRTLAINGTYVLKGSLLLTPALQTRAPRSSQNRAHGINGKHAPPPAEAGARIRPDPSVCGLGSARLLLFSGPLGPGYRKGDQVITRAGDAGRVLCHEGSRREPTGPDECKGDVRLVSRADAAQLLRHDLHRQAQPSRAIAFARSERRHGRRVSWQTPVAAA